MKNTTQRKLPLQGSRPAYRTLKGWALGTLIEQHAVRQCEHHGHALDRGDPEAWNGAREIAAKARQTKDGHGPAVGALAGQGHAGHYGEWRP